MEKKVKFLKGNFNEDVTNLTAAFANRKGIQIKESHLLQISDIDLLIATCLSNKAKITFDPADESITIEWIEESINKMPELKERVFEPVNKNTAADVPGEKEEEEELPDWLQ